MGRNVRVSGSGCSTGAPAGGHELHDTDRQHAEAIDLIPVVSAHRIAFQESPDTCSVKKAKVREKATTSRASNMGCLSKTPDEYVKLLLEIGLTQHRQYR